MCSYLSHPNIPTPLPSPPPARVYNLVVHSKIRISAATHFYGKFHTFILLSLCSNFSFTNSFDDRLCLVLKPV